MVSNLPLLFARGSPTSLENMCLEELQLFLKFVLKCEQNSSNLDLKTLNQPAWWPKGVDWGETILCKKEQKGKTSSILRSAIKACYTYHECMYLLEFCRKLITFTGGIENLQVVDNRDGTRSLLNRSNKKLLVTFRAENQDYDKEVFKPSDKISSAKTSKGLPQLGNIKKQLVTSKSDNTSDPNFTKCVDVYLCDSCDKDFDNLSALVEHERICGQQQQSLQSTFDTFLASLKLHKTGTSVHKKEIKASERPRAKDYDRFMEIDLASPLGKYIVTSSNLTIAQMNPAARGYKSLEEYNADLDARCPGTIKSLKNSNAFMDIKGKWNSSFKNSRKKANLWSHTYCFTPTHVETRMRVIKAGLSLWSMRHFRRCQKKQASVRLKRLNKDMIENLLTKKNHSDHGLIVKNTARKSFPISKRIEQVSKFMSGLTKEDEKVIDELLEDSSDDAEMEVEVKKVPAEPNNIVQFASGFATWSEKHGPAPSEPNPSAHLTTDQIKQESDVEGYKRISVPRPLPELQKIFVNDSAGSNVVKSNRDIECVDLCSSDEEW